MGQREHTISTMTVDRTMPWLGFPPAVDLVNTIVVTPRQPVDLLTTEDDLSAWVTAEMGRIPGVEAAPGRLSEVRHLRGVVRAALFAAAEGLPPPRRAVEAINAASAAAPGYPVLRGGHREEEVLTTDRFACFRAAVARSAIEIVAEAEREGLSVCRAPSCGMLFLRRSIGQRWCCDACGNRARVARHAHRRQQEEAPRIDKKGVRRR